MVGKLVKDSAETTGKNLAEVVAALVSLLELSLEHKRFIINALIWIADIPFAAMRGRPICHL